MADDALPVFGPDELVQVNRDLDAQLKELVRGQQRLFLSERQNSRQLARLEALAAFATAATELADPNLILTRAASLVLDLFPFEQCVGFLAQADGGLTPAVACAVEGLAGDSVCRLAQARGLQLAKLEPIEPSFDLRSRLVERYGATLKSAIECFGALFDDGDESPERALLVLPLARSEGDSLGLMLFRRVTTTLGFHEELPASGGMAFLALVARHVAVTLANARLVRSLEASYGALEKAQAALVGRERLAALGELSAQVAHEVRNPLCAMFNSLALLRPLLARSAWSEEGLGLVSILEEEAARINAIVSELLEFARPMTAALQREQITPVIRAAIDGLHASVPSAVVRVTAASDLPLVHLDVRLMRQALVNLLVNAAQAGEDGAPIELHVTRNRDALQIMVVNSGPAIPRAMLDRIFEPFFTTKATGTGLGLSVVQRAVHAHGGEVTVTSDEVGRTVFAISLPVA